MQRQESLPAVLTMGFSPAAALTTWRLSLSRAFQCYSYWPTKSVTFQSEVFGTDQVYEPLQFDLSNSKQISSLPSKSFAVVILVVPTIKDVARMCKKIHSVLSKNTLLLVDVSGGIAPLQRLVKTNLGTTYQVSGMICDIDAEFTVQGDKWTVVHRKLSSNSSSSSNAITLEPSAALAKLMSSLEASWSATGLSTIHTKTSGVFGEIQWQRTIGVVVFEVLSVALDIPEPEKLANSLISKPIIEGLIGELTMVASASGIKGLPSKSQLLNRGPNLARRAPNTFQNNRASRIYYDVYRKAPIALDFLLLLPILLSDELPKGGATPYLESLYAYVSRTLDLNSGAYQSELFQRIDSTHNNSDKQGVVGVDPALIAQLDARAKSLEQRENDLQARETRCKQVMEQLQTQQQEHSERVAQFDNQWAQNERRLQSFEELNARAEQLRLREEQMNDVERKASQRERAYRQRELELVNREQALIARESDYNVKGMSGGPQGGVQQHQNTGMPNGGMPNGIPNGMPNGSTPPQMSPQIPMTPGGTVYSRFDPRAPSVSGPPPQHQQQQHPIHNGPGSQFYGVPSSSSASIVSNSRPRHSVSGAPPQMMSRASSRPQIASPQTMQMQFYGPGSHAGTGIPPGHQMGQQPGNRSRRQPRRMSVNDDVDVASMTSARRRQQSMPNNVYGAGNSQNTLFSQNFQLDGIMGSATDRYHFVSRAKNKQKDIKLSSDEDAYSANRKFIHGGGHVSSPSNGYASSVNNMPFDTPAGYPSTSSRYINPGDLSGASQSTVMSSRKSMGNVHSVAPPLPTHHHHQQEQPQSLLPTNIVPSGPDFAGFNFGETLDVNNNGSSGSSGSHNISSTGSNGTPNRSRSGTPPTPQGTIDPTVLNNGQKWAEPPQAQTVPFNIS